MLTNMKISRSRCAVIKIINSLNIFIHAPQYYHFHCMINFRSALQVNPSQLFVNKFLEDNKYLIRRVFPETSVKRYRYRCRYMCVCTEIDNYIKSALFYSFIVLKNVNVNKEYHDKGF